MPLQARGTLRTAEAQLKLKEEVRGPWSIVGTCKSSLHVVPQVGLCFGCTVGWGSGLRKQHVPGAEGIINMQRAPVDSVGNCVEAQA